MTQAQLQPHQLRVVTERDELKVKYQALMDFGTLPLFATLPEQEQELLVTQSEWMAGYLETLNSRIAGFHGAKLYACHKQVFARPMTRGEYNILRSGTLPADENGEDEGFLVEYIDGGASNHPDYAGYISWSPKAVFEAGYAEVE
jgi:hypothetical protein